MYSNVYSHQSLCVGASLDAAAILNSGAAQVAVNWQGGLHHAKRDSSSGFCYFNDIVLAILELLKFHARVLYIDIDVHHGDGVEEAFLQSSRVFTLSFHFHDGKFFPKTGSLDEPGPQGHGRGHTLNVPLDKNCSDDIFISVFTPVVLEVIARYRPGAIVLQAGADGLGGDSLGQWNLSSKGHATAVKIVLEQGYPTLLLGGGGYTIRNVSRCWAYDTGVALGLESLIPDKIPANAFSSYWSSKHWKDTDDRVSSTTVNAKENVVDSNSRQSAALLMSRVLSRLKETELAPSIGVMITPPSRGLVVGVGKSVIDNSHEENEDQEASSSLVTNVDEATADLDRFLNKQLTSASSSQAHSSARRDMDTAKCQDFMQKIAWQDFIGMSNAACEVEADYESEGEETLWMSVPMEKDASAQRRELVSDENEETAGAIGRARKRGRWSGSGFLMHWTPPATF